MDQIIFEKLCYLVWDVSTSPGLKALTPSTSQPTAIQYSSFVLSIVTCIVGLASNLIVIFVTGFLMKKNKYKIWFLNLALADFTFLLFLPLHAVSVIRGMWPYGANMCKLYNFLSFVNMYAGIYILTMLNIDRTVSVAKPVWHLRFHSIKFCRCMCVVIWVSSAICSVPAIIYSDVNEGTVCTLSPFDFTQFANMISDVFEMDSEEIDIVSIMPREACSNITDVGEPTDFITWDVVTITTIRLVVPLVVVGYVVPLCVILFSNIIITLHVKKSKTAASSRLYRVVIVSILSFFCTRTPYVFAYITFLVSISTIKFMHIFNLSIALPLLFSIAATNCVLNPLVYVLVGKQVRSEIIMFLRKKFRYFREREKREGDEREREERETSFFNP